MSEDVNKSNDGGGLRFNDDKNPLDLVPPSLMFAVGNVLKAGAAKYAPRNWEKGMKWNTVYGCMLRHTFKWASPFHSDNDEETGLNHLHHVACNVAMLIEYELTCPELDDRIKYKDKLVNPKVGPLTDEDLEIMSKEQREKDKDEYYSGNGSNCI